MKFAFYLGKLYNSLGCWKDASARAIDGYKGVLGVQGCYEEAKSLGYTVFGVQYGGQCFTTATADDTYTKYGAGKGCSSAGTGGTWLNEVYRISMIYTSYKGMCMHVWL